jgi:AcrR family transcriptional regulator
MGDYPPILITITIVLFKDLPMPRLAVANKEEIQNDTRKKLLDAAANEFAAYGFTGANINRISIAAGFAKGTIYNYFPSKRELMLALIDKIGRDHSNFIIQKVVMVSEPHERIKQFFTAGFAFVEQFPAHSQIAISAVYGFDQEFKVRIYRAYQDLFNLIIDDIVGMGIAQNKFRSNDPDVAAALLMSVYLGGSSLLSPDGSIWFDPEKAADFVMDGFRQR